MWGEDKEGGQMNTGARRNIQLGGQKDGKKGRKKKGRGEISRPRERTGYLGGEYRISRLGG